jgi:hypothetical protein
MVMEDQVHQQLDNGEQICRKHDNSVKSAAIPLTNFGQKTVSVATSPHSRSLSLEGPHQLQSFSQTDVTLIKQPE